MADDHRYDWLDDDAVERLLRGGTVDSAALDEDTRPAAERLAASLADLRTPVLPEAGADGPLPGEEAALAAFRAARAEGAPGIRATPLRAVRGGASGAAAENDEPVVRLATPARNRSFLRRPVKGALALALAGCALGGVAVAAGTGVLPGPFGSAGGAPAPATSVSAAEDRDTRTLAPGIGDHGATPSPGATGTLRPSERPSASGSATPGHGSPTGRDGRHDGPGESPSATTGPGDDRAGTGKDGGAEQDPKAYARVCRLLLARQRVDEDEVRTLERAEGGAAQLRALCERILKSGTVPDWDEVRRTSRPVPHSRSGSHTRPPTLPVPLPPALPAPTAATPVLDLLAR
ncbi:hypothetical protein SNS2_3331 [Streptomyces netropsis]|uniref:Uncharacterized protein n=1 Tax=Streptomyces syringium TaxID=76729 RepID=A0ABS4Y7E3_9ACTN|nr:hypothetical protein [Streptomyces syringium]MBP2404709.1 hypothetical protein [Streptomyces syringium]SPE57659.1 hypothetical protein SNS2_3331 [Streptomyces netropsis]